MHLSSGYMEVSERGREGGHGLVHGLVRTLRCRLGHGVISDKLQVDQLWASHHAVSGDKDLCAAHHDALGQGFGLSTGLSGTERPHDPDACGCRTEKPPKTTEWTAPMRAQASIPIGS